MQIDTSLLPKEAVQLVLDGSLQTNDILLDSIRKIAKWNSNGKTREIGELCRELLDTYEQD